MQPLYKIVPYFKLEHLLFQKSVYLLKTKKLADGFEAKWYSPTKDKNIKNIIEVNEIVYVFDEPEDAVKWFFQVQKAPERVKRVIAIGFEYLSKPEPLNYNVLTYQHFIKCRNRGGFLKVLSERIFDDGRVSVLYADIPDYRNNPNYRLTYYLVIGRLVFTHWDFERLILLEASIATFRLTSLRPELSGKITYVPAYGLAKFNKHHKKFLKGLRIIKSYNLPGSIVAELYADEEYPRLCKVIAGELIYSFKSLFDCELIMNALVSFGPLQQQASNKELIKQDFETIGARINRYVNADLTWRKSTVMVLQTGSFTNLNALS